MNINDAIRLRNTGFLHWHRAPEVAAATHMVNNPQADPRKISVATKAVLSAPLFSSTAPIEQLIGQAAARLPRTTLAADLLLSRITVTYLKDSRTDEIYE